MDSDGRRGMAADTTLTRVMTRPKEKGHGGRSEAYAWLRLRFEQLSPRLRNRPGWREVAEDMAAGGVKGGRGKPLTGRAVMRIWPKVCQDLAIEEPWRVEAVRLALLQGESVQKPRRREPERGVDADRPPPVVTAPAPRPPIPHYPPPPPPMTPVQGMVDQRLHSELSQEERRARTDANILRLRRRFAETSGRNPDEIE